VKRPVLVAAVLALAVVMMATAGSASSARVKIGAERACKTGQFRCFAMIQTRDGKRVTAASPFALPAGYGPADYHKAYSLPTTATGNQTVTIVDAYDDKTIAADLANYSTAFGIPKLPSCTSTVTTSCFKKINLGAPVNSAVSTGWDIEIALDVETVHAICQNCKIVLVEAVDSTFSRLEAAVDRAHTEGGIISNSYGSYGFDGSSPGDDAHYNHPKDAIVVSAGDDGYGAAYPAVLNSVVAVGGTKLTLNSTGGYGSERAWGPDATHAWGTGSGCANGKVSGASSIPAQTFQKNVANYTNTGCGTTRGMNDVSANADPNTGSAVFAKSMGWGVIGGTSLSAPLISAVFALRGDYNTVNYPAQLLYSHFGTTSFRDVKTGTDDAGNYPLACTKVPACNAVKGYDLPTGVGTPKGTSGF
jgi:subtilase family serine protease